MKLSKPSFLTFLFVVFVLLSAAPCDADEQYSFSFNGEKTSPRILSLNGTHDNPQKGDVVCIYDFFIVLDEPGEYAFKDIYKETGSCTLIKKDGSKILIGVYIAQRHSSKDDLEIINPLEKMTKAEIASLRGIYIKTWSKGLEDKLKLIDLEKTIITIGEMASKDNSDIFPPLPEKLKYLTIAEHSNTGIKDYYPISKLKSLIFLNLNVFSMDEIDVTRLSGLKELRYFYSGGTKLINVESLGNLSQLTSLSLLFQKDIADISFIKKLKNLKDIDIRMTGIADLSPLANLKELHTINADMSRADKLPSSGFPALKTLRIMSTQIEKKDVDAFAKSHPDCKVFFDWDDALKNSLNGITRIRIRTGGTCHRNIEDEKTTFEEKDPKNIKEFISKIKVVSSKSGFHCMCCGNPTFEFYKGDELAVMIGFHHGRSLRWSSGEWPGDALLTEDSADFLAELLAKHGETEAAEEREMEKRQQIVAKREYERVKKILPKDMLKKFMKINDEKEASELFTTGIKDNIKRAEILIKVLGTSKSSWNTYSSYIFLAKSLLNNTDKDILLKALKNVSGDPEGEDGASRFLFGEDKWNDFEDKALSELIRLFGENALSNPRLTNRRTTLEALGKTKNKEAIKLLVSALNGHPRPRELDKDDDDEPGGMSVFKPGASDLKKPCTDQAYAALILARIGHKESLEFIKELAKRSGGENRKALLEAVKILEGK